MTKVVQPPIPLEDMTPTQREHWEQALEDMAEHQEPSVWDTMESLRVLLNSSQIEAMHYIKKSSRFGDQCAYYLKAKHLFDRDDRAAILTLLDQLKAELEANEID